MLRASARALSLVVPLLLLPLATVRCSGGVDQVAPPADGGGSTVGDAGGPVVEADQPLVRASKVDLLFVVDNSASMGDKQQLLSTAVGRILRRLGEASADHKAIDLHVGVITSSLGGGDVCQEDDPKNPRRNDHGRLRTTTVDAATLAERPVAGAEAGFLSFAPGGDIAALEKSAAELIAGAGQNGCGLEAQLEAMYRFLAQPDPPLTVEVDTGTKKPSYKGVDSVLLAQRKAFLRPDSAVAIVMLTDEDDSGIDPFSIAGTGWGFGRRDFPGSNVARGQAAAQGKTAPRATTACDKDPASVDCRSCALCDGDAKCMEDPNCTMSSVPGMNGPGYDGFYGPADDDLNVRMHHMKRRFGVDPQYPVERYINALSYRRVPRRDTDHDANGNYVHAQTCTNPLFAASLPATDKEELCDLPEGARSRQLVLFQLIGGLPPALAGLNPDWTKILGANPERYDFSGIDPHMVQSIAPRAALLAAGAASSKRGDNGTDPVHGREWDSQKKDLQYACTLELPTARTCVGYAEECDSSCSDENGAPVGNAPLCHEDGTNKQVRAKAYPTIRELRVAKGLGDRGLVSSICSVDPVSGYGPLLETLATRVGTVLAK